MRYSHEKQKEFVRLVKRITTTHPNDTNVEIMKKLDTEHGLKFDLHYVGRLVKKAHQERIARAEYDSMTTAKAVRVFMDQYDILNEITLEGVSNPNLRPEVRLQYIREARTQMERRFWMFMKSGILDHVSEIDEEKLRQAYQVPEHIRERFFQIMKNWGVVKQLEEAINQPRTVPAPVAQEVSEAKAEKSIGPEDPWAWERLNGLVS